MVATLSIAALDALTRALARPDAGTDADRERTRTRRRASGAYFTPRPLVRFVVAETLAPLLADPGLVWRDGVPALRVLDPSAGDGRFLGAVVDLLVDRGRGVASGMDASLSPAGVRDLRRVITERCIVGMERDPEFARLAGQRLGCPIHCCEALLDAPSDIAGVDAVVGNPPYIRSVRFSRSDRRLWDALRGRYAATSHGEWDLYAAFIEQAWDWIAPGGEIGLVVPSRWLTAAFACQLREKLARAGAVRAVVDFGATQLFDGATTYASVIFLSRASGGSASAAAAGTDGITVARYRGDGWQRGHVAVGELSGRPWRLAVGAQAALIERLSQRGPALGDIARIVKGAGTNADPVYILTDAEVRGELVIGDNKASGERIAVERAACRPCLRGRDVRPFGSASDGVQCIVPYDRGGALWSAATLAGYPQTRGHFERHRERLEMRESGRYRDDAYFRFGRAQNLVFHGLVRPKVVIPDVARAGRAGLDDRGAMVLDSAYALRLRHAGHSPDDCDGAGYSLALLLAIFNSPIVAWWLGQTGIPLRGGYLRLKTAYLASMPLPAVDDRGLIERIERQVARVCAGESCDGELDELVREVYGIEPATWRSAIVER